VSKPSDVIDAYGALLARAIEVARLFKFGMDPAFDGGEVLWIDGEYAVIGYPYNDSYDPGMGWQNTVRFPAALLSATDAQIAAALEERLAIEATAERVRVARYRREREASERAAYEALKAKFGD
jgi:hypothetical protein